jgi:DNA invertase Pin-like site-specific DNA recombinase
VLAFWGNFLPPKTLLCSGCYFGGQNSNKILEFFVRKIIFAKKGIFAQRSELKAALDYMREGDTLVVWKLSRLARSIRQVIKIAHDLEQREIKRKVLTQNIDTGTPEGRLFFHMTAAFDEFQRELIVENTRANLAAARKRGAQRRSSTKHD